MWNELNDFDRGWLTGIVEGEGYIAARKTNRGAIEFRLEVTSTDMETVSKLQQFVGGKIYGPYHYGKSMRKPYYAWRLSCREEVSFLLRGMYPYFSAHRQAQVDGAFLKYETRTTQRGGDLSRYRRNRPFAD